MDNTFDYMQLAINEAKQSIDPTRGVGALLYRNKDSRVVSTGHNAFPFWLNTSTLSSITKNEKAVLASHAEIECLENTYNSLDYNDTETKYTMVITCHPCLNCAIAIVNSNFNITKVVYLKDDHSYAFKQRFSIDESKQYLIDNNVEVIEICRTH